ncbi:MAG: hypothetical protein EOP84_21315, partial [Verrucomicrobiaceae bacterium]
MKSPLLFTLLFGAGLLTGYGIGQLRSASENNTPPSGEAPLTGHTAQADGTKIFALPVDRSGASERLSALVSAAQEPEYLKGRAAMYRLLEQVSSSETPALLDSIQRLPPSLRETLMAALIERWLKADETAAGDWIRAHPDDRDYLEAWARYSPLAALSAVLASKQEGAWYRDAFNTALDQLAGKDSLARLAVLTSLPASANRDTFIAWELHELSKTDPATALDAANRSLTGKARAAATHVVLMEWVKMDPAAATAQVALLFPEQKSGLFGNTFISHFTRSMAEKNPTAALEFALSLPEELRKYPLVAATVAWAKTEPLAALEWSRENGVDVMRTFQVEHTSTADSVLQAALTAQPEETIRWILEQPANPERQKFVRSALENQLRNEAATAGILSDPGSPILRLFHELPAAGQAKLAGDLGHALAKKGTFPDEAQWRTHFPDETVRAQVKAGAIREIYEQSADRAEALLKQIPEGVARDYALQEMVRAQTRHSPATAAERALEITRPELQRTALFQPVYIWLHRDEAACR